MLHALSRKWENEEIRWIHGGSRIDLIVDRQGNTNEREKSWKEERLEKTTRRRRDCVVYVIAKLGEIRGRSKKRKKCGEKRE